MPICRVLRGTPRTEKLQVADFNREMISSPKSHLKLKQTTREGSKFPPQLHSSKKGNLQKRHLTSGPQPWGFCLLVDFWQCLETSLTVTTKGKLLASSGQRPEILLQTGHNAQNSPSPSPSPTENYLIQNIKSSQVEKFWTTYITSKGLFQS